MGNSCDFHELVLKICEIWQPPTIIIVEHEAIVSNWPTHSGTLIFQSSASSQTRTKRTDSQDLITERDDFTKVDLSRKPTRQTFWKYCASHSTPIDWSKWNKLVSNGYTIIAAYVNSSSSSKNNVHSVSYLRENCNIMYIALTITRE